MVRPKPPKERCTVHLCFHAPRLPPRGHGDHQTLVRRSGGSQGQGKQGEGTAERSEVLRYSGEEESFSTVVALRLNFNMFIVSLYKICTF